MNRWIAGLLVTVVAAAVVAGAAAAAPGGVATAQTDPATNASDANATSDLSPGERLAGVVGVQGAEIEGEVESRAFDIALRESESDRARADVVGDRLSRAEERLAELEQRQRELRERRAAGELSQGAYAARTATTTARIESLARGLNRTANASAALPAPLRDERGVDDERLATLRERADDLRGPEVAAIARGVAGPGVGGPVGPDRRGPPDNATERGPPEDRGPDADGPPGDRDRGDGPPGDDAGPPVGAPGEAPDDGPSENDSESGQVGPPDGDGAGGAPNGSGPADSPAPPGDGDSETSPGGSTDGPAGNDSAGNGSDGNGADNGGTGGSADDGETDGNGRSSVGGATVTPRQVADGRAGLDT